MKAIVKSILLSNCFTQVLHNASLNEWREFWNQNSYIREMRHHWKQHFFFFFWKTRQKRKKILAATTSFEKVDFLQRYIDFFNISPSLFCMKIVCINIKYELHEILYQVN